MESLQRQQAARLARGPDGAHRRPAGEPDPGPPPPAPRRLPGPDPRPPPAAAGGGEEEEEEDDDEEEEEEEEEEPRELPRPPHHEWTYEEQFKQVGGICHTSAPAPAALGGHSGCPDMVSELRVQPSFKEHHL